MNEKTKPIHGLQINLTVDMLLFTDVPVTTQEDINTLKENVGKIEHDIKQMLVEKYHRTDLDDTICTTNMVNYINDDNISDYIAKEVYVINE